MDMIKLMNQARKMQSALKKAQKQAAKTRVEGTAADGLVRVVMSGNHQLRSVHLDASLQGRDMADIERLVGDALRDALGQVAAVNKQALGALQQD